MVGFFLNSIADPLDFLSCFFVCLFVFPGTGGDMHGCLFNFVVVSVFVTLLSWKARGFFIVIY